GRGGGADMSRGGSGGEGSARRGVARRRGQPWTKSLPKGRPVREIMHQAPAVAAGPPPGARDHWRRPHGSKTAGPAGRKVNATEGGAVIGGRERGSDAKRSARRGVAWRRGLSS